MKKRLNYKRLKSVCTLYGEKRKKGKVLSKIILND